MNKAIKILLEFNDASRMQAEQFSQMLLEAFNAGNVTDAQYEDVSGLLERHKAWCAENKEHIRTMGYGR